MSKPSYLSVFFHACIPPLLIVAGAVLILWLADERTKISLLLMIFLAGAAGGVISNYLRLKEINPDNVESTAVFQVYVTPIISGTLGWIAYSAFLTGLVEGPLFPKFSGRETTYTDVYSMFNAIRPATTMDAAKSLLWAFVAGFAEKLVPNVLDKLAGKVQPNSEKK